MPDITELPTPKDDPDFTHLLELVRNYIKDCHETGYVDDDYEHYIYEEACKAIYGEGIFKWINELK